MKSYIFECLNRKMTKMKKIWKFQKVPKNAKIRGEQKPGVFQKDYVTVRYN